MGRVFITDEVNDNYTADVTSTGMLPQDSYSSAYLAGAATSSSKWAISGVTSCYLKSVVITDFPATATTLTLVNASATAETTSTGATGRIARIYVPAASCATSVGALGRTLDLGIYVSKGLTYYLCAGDAPSAGVVFVYRNS